MAINSVRMYLSEKNLIHNMEYLNKNFKKNVLAVVKANAYGHGIHQMTEMLFRNGYKDFAVARLSEAEEIVRHKDFSGARIVIFESIGAEYLDIIKKNDNFHMSINDFDELKEAIDYGIPLERIQLKIDFGFGRNGISLDRLDELKKYIEKNDMKFSGIYSHLFSVNYEEGLEIIQKFKDVINYLGNHRFEMVHLQNSSGVENFGTIDYVTHLRVGMLVYGLQEDGYYDPNLRQVFSLKGRVAGIRNLENSDYVAYNKKEKLQVGDCKYVAKVKFGYGDGFLKFNENTICLIRNKEFNISLVTMDNTFIEVHSGIKVGDEVTFYPNVKLLDHILKMKRVELFTILSPRIERVIVV